MDEVISKCQKFRFTCKSQEHCIFIRIGKIVSLKGYKKLGQYNGENVSNCLSLTLHSKRKWEKYLNTSMHSILQ